MRNLIISLLIVASFIGTNHAAAQTETDVLASCLVDELNGKERKQLAKWIFFAIAAHPEIKPYSTVKELDLESSNKSTGALISRLLTKNCPNELSKANKANPLALQKAFEFVGQVAMQELMTNDDVTKAISGYANYIDQEKIGELLNSN